MARARKAKIAIPRGGLDFSVAALERLAGIVRTMRLPNGRVTVSDNVQPGLRAIIRDTGGVSFHAHYEVNGSRPYLRIGGLPETSIAEARELTKTILALAAKGIDPQDGLHTRLIRELAAKGAAWRP
jgi:hypothetical protein